MRRYERAHVNEVWCGDSSVGPYLKTQESFGKYLHRCGRKGAAHQNHSFGSAGTSV